MPNKRGAQQGNQNARRTHTRLAVSFDGAMVARIHKRLEAQGCANPQTADIKAYILSLVEKATS